MPGFVSFENSVGIYWCVHIVIYIHVLYMHVHTCVHLTHTRMRAHSAKCVYSQLKEWTISSFFCMVTKKDCQKVRIPIDFHHNNIIQDSKYVTYKFSMPRIYIGNIF